MTDKEKLADLQHQIDQLRIRQLESELARLRISPPIYPVIVPMPTPVIYPSVPDWTYRPTPPFVPNHDPIPWLPTIC